MIESTWETCYMCEKEFFVNYDNQLWCNKCLHIIKKQQPTYNIDIISFDGATFQINVVPKVATFNTILKQIQKKCKNLTLLHTTHSLILKGKNVTRTESPRLDNVFVEGLRDNDKLYLIKNDSVELRLKLISGKTLSIDTTIEDTVCGLTFAIESKYKIYESLQVLFLGEQKLCSSKTLFYYGISSKTNNELSLVIKQHELFTNEYLIHMKESAFEHTNNNTHFNISVFQEQVLKTANEKGIQPLNLQ